jgi:hypothetical protein
LKSFFSKPYTSLYLSLVLQRSSLALLLFSYLIAFVSRLRLVRSSFLIIFFFADNMSAAVPAIPVRPVAGQTTIGSDKASPFFPGGRKLLLSGHKVDKIIFRLRHGWC